MSRWANLSKTNQKRTIAKACYDTSKNMAKRITKKINIIDLVREHPESGQILLTHGFHCLGCALASFETLEQGARAHGMNDDQIKDLVSQINQAIKKTVKAKEQQSS